MHKYWLPKKEMIEGESQFPLNQHAQKVDATVSGEVRVEAWNVGPAGVNGKITPYPNAVASNAMISSDCLQESPVPG